MQLFNAKQIREWDAFTIAHEPIRSIDLMERAAQACVEEIGKIFREKECFYIFCGKGNNGGDGLAIARLLYQKGREVTVFVVGSEKEGSSDFLTNEDRLKDIPIAVSFFKDRNYFPDIPYNAIVIDAIFGSGLNKPLKGFVAELVTFLNGVSNIKIAIDVPSGMYLDESSKNNIVLKADYTFTFQQLKFCFLLAENAPFLGKLSVLDIGLSKEYQPQESSILEIVDLPFVQKIYKPRNIYGHKGTFGHALLVAGNKGKMGAAVLAALGCLKSGVGLLTCNIPETESLIFPIAIPEAMTVWRNEEIDFEKYKSIGVGPGLGIAETSILKKILDNAKSPLVLDADALNMIALNPEWLSLIPANSILSPHPKEFERLFGKQENEVARIRKALEISKQYDFMIILKGHYTLVANQGKGFFNTTGNAGMATGGSGDTLTGILTSLLAQGYSGLEGAILGVFIHGLAGDLALTTESEESLLPSDISNFLGSAFQKVNARR
ncbi:MAG: bifunctional ADP-dependent NAD(P)H-hydrate dehydratase/NAD(P)H-hydrate epimerase [Pseudopedobacter saltans]|uniref:Bifunctional NAD(P)H-hydrate repair enzyme n=1 Tax=Pseudopedobacter saltans TaxID=151895 RepID=A0A2W5HBU5_9SPHI|nr:MAG: bifunctional ADP-dependent NAD(P)H-hydrate dehydratase/NAD(P)H-hydrate epimerase [Pseudopedobacter saltans]